MASSHAGKSRTFLHENLSGFFSAHSRVTSLCHRKHPKETGKCTGFTENADNGYVLCPRHFLMAAKARGAAVTCHVPGRIRCHPGALSPRLAGLWAQGSCPRPLSQQPSWPHGGHRPCPKPDAMAAFPLWPCKIPSP